MLLTHFENVQNILKRHNVEIEHAYLDGDVPDEFFIITLAPNKSQTVVYEEENDGFPTFLDKEGNKAFTNEEILNLGILFFDYSVDNDGYFYNDPDAEDEAWRGLIIRTDVIDTIECNLKALGLLTAEAEKDLDSLVQQLEDSIKQ